MTPINMILGHQSTLCTACMPKLKTKPIFFVTHNAYNGTTYMIYYVFYNTARIIGEEKRDVIGGADAKVKYLIIHAKNSECMRQEGGLAVETAACFQASVSHFTAWCCVGATLLRKSDSSYSAMVEEADRCRTTSSATFLVSE